MVFIKKKVEKSDAQKEAEKKEEAQRKAGIQDDFQAKGFEIADFLQTHPKFFFGGVGILLLFVVGYTAINHFVQEKNLAASSLYLQAVTEFDALSKESTNEETNSVRRSFQTVVDAYLGKGVANLALINIGNLSLQLNEVPAANDAFKRAKIHSEQGSIRFLADFGLAKTFEQMGDHAQALKHLDDIRSADWKAMEDEIRYQTVRLSLKTGDRKKADLNLRALKEKFPNSSFVAKAESLLSAHP